MKYRKYRKKPVVIEAYQTDTEMDIATLEGTMHASPGDYIIRGVNGEFYPCKPDIFVKTYEAVEQPITNYDRIHAMSSKQLASWLKQTMPQSKDGRVYLLSPSGMTMTRTADVLGWLNSECKGGGEK